MIGKLKLSVSTMVQQARNRIKEIPATKAIDYSKGEDVCFVDIRDIRERKREGFIPGSYHCPRGMVEFWVDPESPYFKAIFGEDKTFVFYCGSGWRSALTVATLVNMGFYSALHISDGFSGWMANGGPIEK